MRVRFLYSFRRLFKTNPFGHRRYKGILRYLLHVESRLRFRQQCPKLLHAPRLIDDSLVLDALG